jgi:alanyl-tRNA synthetase
VDEYRVGKSLRKKGFAAADLATRRDEASAAVDRTLTAWIGSGAPVSIVRDPGALGLSDRRRWRAELPDGTVEIPCGGTHLRSLSELSGAEVQLELAETEGALALTMRTTASLA